jgi:hypothetical protein
MKVDAFTILVYVILIVVIIYSIRAENIDIMCQDKAGEICDALTGRAYAHGKPEPGDTKDILLGKVKITARYEMNSIHWRRAFITAALSAFIILYIMKNRLPNGVELAIGFIVIYIITYLVLTLFQKWVAEPALQQMAEIITALKEV